MNSSRYIYDKAFNMSDIYEVFCGKYMKQFSYGLLWYNLAQPTCISEYSYQDIVMICSEDNRITIREMNDVIRKYLYVSIKRIIGNTYHLRTGSAKYMDIVDFLSCFHQSIFNDISCVDHISTLLMQQLFSRLTDYSYRTNVHSIVLMPNKLKQSGVFNNIIHAAECIFRNYIACNIIRLRYDDPAFDYGEFISNNGLQQLLFEILEQKRLHIRDVVEDNLLNDVGMLTSANDRAGIITNTQQLQKCLDDLFKNKHRRHLAVIYDNDLLR